MNSPLPQNTPLYALIVAGGSGSRMQSPLAKQYLPLGNTPILIHTLAAFKAVSDALELILVLPEKDFGYWKELCHEYAFNIPHQLVAGGNSRFQSVQQGLKQVPAEALVAIHDGVRPLINPQIIKDAYAVAHAAGAAVVAVALKDSIRQLRPDGSSQSRDRQQYMLVQTPQTFQAAAIKAAYQSPELPTFTDCASVAEAAGMPIQLVEGSYQNLKITSPEDLVFAEAILGQRAG